MTVRALALRPNWASPIRVSLGWRTDLVVARDGTEQRRALRSTPRRRIELRALADGDDKRRLNRLLGRHAGDAMKIGDPTRRALLSTALAQGAAVASVETVPGWLAAGAEVALAGKPGVVFAIVDSVAGTAVTLEAAADRDWPAGAALHPVVEGRLGTRVSMALRTDDVSEPEVDFDVDPGSEVEPAFVWPVDLFDGREVLLRRPDWARAPSADFAQARDTIDPGRGVLHFHLPVDHAARTVPWLFTSAGEAEIGEVDSFLHRMRGRCGEFYAPTWEDDLVPAEPLVQWGTQLRVAGTETADEMGDDPVHQAIVLLTRDGRRMFRAVTGIAVDAGDSVLTLDRGWPEDIALGAIDRICWLPLHRLGADEAVVEWITDSVTQAQLNVRTLPAAVSEYDAPVYDDGTLWLIEIWGWGAMQEETVDAFDVAVNVTYPAVSL